MPFTVYKTGIGWRTDKVDSMTGSWHDLWNPQAAKRIFTLDDQDEAIAMAALLLGYDVNTAKAKELDEIKKLLISQKKYLRAYSSDDVNNMARGDAWIHHMWSGDFVYLRQGWSTSPRTSTSRRPARARRSTPTPTAIPTNAKHPGTAMLFIDYLLRPEIAKKNMAYLYYPFPVRDAASTFQDLVKDVPACNVEPGRPREPRRLPAPQARRGPAPRRCLDRGQGQLMATDQAVAPRQA